MNFNANPHAVCSTFSERFMTVHSRALHKSLFWLGALHQEGSRGLGLQSLTSKESWAPHCGVQARFSWSFGMQGLAERMLGFKPELLPLSPRSTDGL